jgi:glyoxylase-like metal-dependent hydrolase (beta-lactamase superfamily II)
MSANGIDHHAAISAISERVTGLSKRKVTMRSVAVALALMDLSLCGPASALETVKVTDGIYAFVGEKTQRSPLNLGNNATFGLVVTTDGAMLIDPGGSWKGAAALHAAIRKVTDQPVRYVVNTGGQDHRWLGNGYWHKQGAVIIAATTAIADQKARGSLQLSMLHQLLGGELAGTEPRYAEFAFERSHTFQLGSVVVEVRHVGPAHTPGDSFVWLPSKRVVFTGDVVYVERMLGVIDVSRTKSWLAAFEAIAALQPAYVVPGHGAPTRQDRAKADTYDYLVNLRGRMRAHIDAGADIIGAPNVDQTQFAHLEQFAALARRNAQAVFAEMEFE